MTVKWEDLPEDAVRTWRGETETKAFAGLLAEMCELAKDDMVKLLEQGHADRAKTVACKASICREIISILTPAAPSQEQVSEAPFKDPALP